MLMTVSISTELKTYRHRDVDEKYTGRRIIYKMYKQHTYLQL